MSKTNLWLPGNQGGRGDKLGDWNCHVHTTLEKKVDICICITDVLCCTPETNTTLNQVHPNKIFLKKSSSSSSQVKLNPKA